MQGGDVAVERGPGRLVEGRPQLDLIAERLEADAGIAEEGVQGGGGFPSAGCGQRLRQVPVVEGDVGLDPGIDQGREELAVEGDPGGVHGARAIGDDPGPRDRQAVAVVAELLDEADVFRPAVVMVAGEIGCRFLPDPLRMLAAEDIPLRRPAPVLPRRSFDLQGGGGGAPDETLWKPELHFPCPFPCPSSASGYPACRREFSSELVTAGGGALIRYAPKETAS